MPFVDTLFHRAPWGVSLLAAASLLAGCGLFSDEPGRAKPKPVSRGVEANPPKSARANTNSPEPTLKPESSLRLGPPGSSRSMEEVRAQAAHRLVAANPNITYTSRAPDVLLAIPVLSVQLNANGTIRYIDVMRYPHQARDTVEIAKAALRRAEPFGDVSHLPKPWRFQETFLFNDQRKFKPLTLDR